MRRFYRHTLRNTPSGCGCFDWVKVEQQLNASFKEDVSIGNQSLKLDVNICLRHRRAESSPMPANRRASGKIMRGSVPDATIRQGV